MSTPRRPLAERFWEKVDKRGPDECWPWTAAVSTKGYGAINEGGRGRILSAHVVAYELVVGPISDGLELDHLCRNRWCVNPAHLEPVTHAENMRRGFWRMRTHCNYGHRFDEANTIWTAKGVRACRACKRIRQRAYYQPKPPRELPPTCGRGHEFTPENTWIRPDRGTRVCRECMRLQNRKRSAA